LSLPSHPHQHGSVLVHTLELPEKFTYNFDYVAIIFVALLFM
jgi:hypothetical protein